MRKIDKFINTDEKTFKRVVGVKYSTFKVMIQEYQKADEKRKKDHKVGGRKAKLCEEDRVLFMLEYYREYRTLQHMAIDYGISEGEASKVVKDVELVLIKSGKFSLPSKRALYETKSSIDFIMIDATESQIQRPKKSKENTILVRKNNIRKKLK
jgi:hypothetical protein